MRQRFHSDIAVDDLDCFALVLGDVDLGEEPHAEPLAHETPSAPPAIKNLSVMVEVHGIEFDVSTVIPVELRDILESKLFEAAENAKEA